MHSPRFIFVFPILCAVGFFSACSKTDPRTVPITATTQAEFDVWKRNAVEKIPAPEMEEFEACLSEIRLGIMQRREATGVNAVAQKLCDAINGKTVHEVLVMGHSATVAWVTKELELQNINREKAEEGLKGPGSDAAKEGLRQFYTLVLENNARLEARLAKAKARLAELETGK